MSISLGRGNLLPSSVFRKSSKHPRKRKAATARWLKPGFDDLVCGGEEPQASVKHQFPDFQTLVQIQGHVWGLLGQQNWSGPALGLRLVFFSSMTFPCVFLGPLPSSTDFPKDQTLTRKHQKRELEQVISVAFPQSPLPGRCS